MALNARYSWCELHRGGVRTRCWQRFVPWTLPCKRVASRLVLARIIWRRPQAPAGVSFVSAAPTSIARSEVRAVATRCSPVCLSWRRTYPAESTTVPRAGHAHLAQVGSTERGHVREPVAAVHDAVGQEEQPRRTDFAVRNSARRGNGIRRYVEPRAARERGRRRVQRSGAERNEAALG